MTKQIRHISILALLLLFIPLFAFGATSDVRFRNIQTQDGLSNDDVNCVFKDSHGFMWFGTASGLNRYDGYSVRIFHSQRPDTTALRDNYVQDIQEDAGGNLWIYAGDTYSVFDPVTESFFWVNPDGARKLGLPAEPKLVRIHGAQIWFVVNDNTIYKSDDGKSVMKVVETTPGFDITDIKAIPNTDKLVAINSGGDLYIIDTDGAVS